MNRSGLVAFIVAVSALGCVGQAEEDIARFDEPNLDVEHVSPNGTSLNGATVGGLNLKGVLLGSATSGGVSLSGVSLSGSTLASASLPGGALNGTLWSGELSDGSAVSLRIDASAALTPGDDLRAYQISYATTSGWAHLCGNDSGGAPIEALALAGVWSYAQGVPGGGAFTADPTRFTFACRHTAIAKCVELGYKPWLAAPAGVAGDLQACTRLLRADYCGDGRSWTVNGTPVDLYDNDGIQSDDEPWAIEAEWTAAGARCTAPAAQTRLSLLALAAIPDCFTAKVLSTCGDPARFLTGTKLMSEFAH